MKRLRLDRAISCLLLGVLGCAQTGEAPREEPRATLWTLEGEELRLTRALAGEETVATFMTVWCETCREEQPALERWASDGARRAITVISGSAVGRAREVAERRQLALETYVDPSGALADRLGVMETPTHVLLSPTGEVLGRYADLNEIPLPAAVAEPKLKLVSDRGDELGTSYDVAVWSTRPSEQVRADLAAARAECRRLERIFSEWRPDSDVSRLNRAPPGELVEVDAALVRLVAASLKLSRATEGAFDITWFSVAQLWNDAAKADRVPSEEELAEALTHVGPDKVQVEAGRLARLDRHTRIGLGGVAKGWIVDALFHFLRARGYQDLIVNIGGDLRAAGVDESGAPHRIRLHDPFDPERVLRDLELGAGAAVATSGYAYRTREIAGETYGHIVDPRTGRPVDFAGSVTVITEDAAMADAMATAMFVLGREEGLALARRTPGLDVVYVTRGPNGEPSVSSSRE